MKRTRIPVICLLLCGLGAATEGRAQGGLGGQLSSTGGQVTVEVLFSSSGFTNEFRLFQPAPERVIGLDSDTGRTVFLGPFPDGAELVFGIFVQDTGQTFLMGPGARNPDGIPHARVQVVPGGFEVGFEDQLGGGDMDYEDAQIRVSGAVRASSGVPEPVPTLGEWAILFLAASLLAAGLYRLRA